MRFFLEQPTRAWEVFVQVVYATVGVVIAIGIGVWALPAFQAFVRRR